MYILGISSYYHDSAASLIKDGKVLWAIEEERFTRKKHDNSFPVNAINFCLKEAKIKARDLDYIAYYEKPLLKFERIIETFVKTYPHSLTPFLQAIPDWLGTKIKVEETIRKTLKYKGKIYFIPHHLSHAAAAYYSSPFEDAAIYTVDGTGEYETTALWKGNKNKILPLKHINFPNSLGLLYSTFTAFLGFRVNEDEYKLMGLAAYGKPVYVSKIRKIIDIKKDGSFNLVLKYFSFREAFRMWSNEFENIFGKPRQAKDKITKRHKDIAASIQQITEEIYLSSLNELHRLTCCPNLTIAGGVSLNAVANGKIYKNSPFKNVWVFGAAGDSGASMGAALFTYYSILKKGRKKKITSLYLGSKYSNKEIIIALDSFNLKYKRFYNRQKLSNQIAEFLSKGKIVGLFNGACEFGPRALGHRSILAKPFPYSMKKNVNKIKNREQFRPFAGSILKDKAKKYMELPDSKTDFPFMTFCFRVKKKKRKNLSAIVHKDNTCRIQTVDKRSGLYYQIIKSFEKKTGVACILNTSFNVAGEPIVETPEQAIKDFLNTKIDILVLGDYLLTK